MSDYDLSPLFRQWIGFDKLASVIQDDFQEVSYPPYNIEKEDDNRYCITLALAGFDRKQLSITIEGPRLTIRGKPSAIERQVRYLHQGLMYKEFSLSFTLDKHITVTKAHFSYGLLNINLERNMPESLQPRRITIETTTLYQPELQNQLKNTARASIA